MLVHQTARRIEQHSVRLAALFVFRDLSAEGTGRGSINAGNLQSRAVYDCAMPVSAHEYHRIVRCNFVEVPASRKHRRLPESFDPATSRYPFARLSLINARLNLCEEVLQVGDAFEVERHLALAHSLQM